MDSSRDEMMKKDEFIIFSIFSLLLTFQVPGEGAAHQNSLPWSLRSKISATYFLFFETFFISTMAFIKAFPSSQVKSSS